MIDGGSATGVPAIRTTDDDSLGGRGLSRVDRLAVRLSDVRIHVEESHAWPGEIGG